MYMMAICLNSKGWSNVTENRNQYADSGSAFPEHLLMGLQSVLIMPPDSGSAFP